MSTAALFDRYYFARPGFETGVARFQNLLLRAISDSARVLEIGAGGSNPMSQFLAAHFRVAGADVSESVLENEFLAEACVYNGRVLPYDSACFDACVSYYVMEHIADPIAHMKEAHRVLRDGGVYVFCTPNLWHYVTLGSALLPHGMHRKLANRLRALGPDAEEPFPTHYRGNTRASIRRAARTAGLKVSTLEMIEFEPCYGRWHSALFYPMMAYERVVNSSRLFAPFRVNIHAVLRSST